MQWGSVWGFKRQARQTAKNVLKMFLSIKVVVTTPKQPVVICFGGIDCCLHNRFLDATSGTTSRTFSWLYYHVS